MCIRDRDSGSGFTKEALLHGTEQFFMDDTIKMCIRDRAIYEASMKKTGGKMNAACMFWDSKGNKTLSYNPESRNLSLIHI